MLNRNKHVWQRAVRNNMTWSNITCIRTQLILSAYLQFNREKQSYDIITKLSSGVSTWFLKEHIVDFVVNQDKGTTSWLPNNSATLRSEVMTLVKVSIFKNW
jgi:hypothetical protein